MNKTLMREITTTCRQLFRCCFRRSAELHMYVRSRCTKFDHQIAVIWLALFALETLRKWCGKCSSQPRAKQDISQELPPGHASCYLSERNLGSTVYRLVPIDPIVTVPIKQVSWITGRLSILLLLRTALPRLSYPASLPHS